MSRLIASRKRKLRCGRNVKGEMGEKGGSVTLRKWKTCKKSLLYGVFCENRETFGALLRTMGHK